MPCLIFEYSGQRRAGEINGRVLIGRRVTHGILVTEPSVSRLHAWIDNREGAYVLTDAGSRLGTFVNGEAIVRYELQHGDQIQIGPALLTFTEDAELPGDIPPMDLNAALPPAPASKAGILFDCKCGAPLWVPNDAAGKRGLCKYCGESITVPIPAGSPLAAKTSPANALKKRVRPLVPTLKRSLCGVCHSDIEPGEEETTCVDCGTTYHTDCWHENYGCSSYGCKQVDVLKPALVAAAEARAQIMAEAHQPTDLGVETGFPLELILLAASVVGSLVGALLFGLPTACVAVTALFILGTGKSQKRGMVMAAMFLSIVGTVVGLALSDFWWLDGRHLSILMQ